MTQAHPRVETTQAPVSPPSFPAVDYERHPAYLHYATGPREQDLAVRELLAELDAALRIASGGALGSSKRRIDALFRAEVDDGLRELVEIALRSVGTAGIEREALRTAEAALRPTLFDYACYASSRRRAERRDAGGREDGANPAATRLGEAGVYATRADPGRVAAIERLAAPLFRELEAAAVERPAPRHQRNVPQQGALWNAILALVRDTGVLRGLSLYDGHPLRVDWATLERSGASQTWWQSPYGLPGVTTGRCAYFHNDHSHRTLKTILYLSPVEMENGPFGFVAGSHRWRRSAVATAMAKALDQGRHRVWCRRHPDAAERYRPYVADPGVREGFMRLPAPLRATSHFGDDVLDGSSLAARLLAGEQVFPSREANCIAFDGDRGVHRGGLVREGTRFALQIGYKEAPSAARRIRRQARRWVRRTLGGPR